jgi:hypothetical protein
MRFGHFLQRTRRGSGSRAPYIYRFPPGRIFAVVWHRWCSDGCQHRALAIAETLGELATGFFLPGVSRAVLVHAMVDQHGPAGQGGTVDRLLALIQSVELAGMDPADLPASYWRDASYCVMLQQQPMLPEIAPVNQGAAK